MLSALSPYIVYYLFSQYRSSGRRGGRGRDRMEVGIITTCAISAYHH